MGVVEVEITLVAPEPGGTGAGALAAGAGATAPLESAGSLSSAGEPGDVAWPGALIGSRGLVPRAEIRREPTLRRSGAGESEPGGLAELRGSLDRLGMFNTASVSGAQMVLVRAYPTTKTERPASSMFSGLRYFI